MASHNAEGRNSIKNKKSRGFSEQWRHYSRGRNNQNVWRPSIAWAVGEMLRRGALCRTSAVTTNDTSFKTIIYNPTAVAVVKNHVDAGHQQGKTEKATGGVTAPIMGQGATHVGQLKKHLFTIDVDNRIPVISGTAGGQKFRKKKTYRAYRNDAFEVWCGVSLWRAPECFNQPARLIN